MIKKHCFTEEWLDSFKKQEEHKRIDKAILEKMIYALHLLEHLKANGLDFIFKGGTSLVLLLEEFNRFSIDIDIICNTDRQSLENILNKVIASSNFKTCKLDEHRSYQEEIPKAHYSFTFDSATRGKYSGTILLDVLMEDSMYPELTEKPIQAKWIETTTITKVAVPTVDAITGDKLTAFAPNTIGIPYFKGKDQQPFSMEICKQLFDLSQLFEKIENPAIVAKSFETFAQQEIAYRKNERPDLTIEDVLRDTIGTCIILARRGKGSTDEKQKFSELQKGIKALGSGFLMKGKFRIDEAVSAAARIAYISAKLLCKDLSPIEFYQGEDCREINIGNPDWSFLNRLKKLPDKSAYYYWYKTLEIMNLVRNE